MPDPGRLARIAGRAGALIRWEIAATNAEVKGADLARLAAQHPPATLMAERPGRGRRRKPVAYPAVVIAHDLHRRYRAGEVVVQDRPEQDNPNRTVRGVRTTWVCDHLLACGSISAEQWQAADRYATTAEAIVAGNGCGLSGSEGGRTPPCLQGNPATWKLAAATDMRQAEAALGPTAAGLVREVVLKNRTVRAIAQAGAGRDASGTMGAVSAALQRLAEHWGIRPSGGSARVPSCRTASGRAGARGT